MEIHHPVELPGKEIKPWKHYAIEFFMLFLAVTAGFFTENQRDRILENQKAKDMAFGLYNELQENTIQISKLIERKKLLISEMDSLINTLAGDDMGNNITLLTYYQASFLMEVDMPVPENANLDQLINSGRLRYFKSRKLVSDISKWDNIISFKFRERYDTDQKRLIEEIMAVNRVFNPVLIDSMRSISFENLFNGRSLSTGTHELFSGTQEELINDNISDVSEVIGWASERKRNAIVRSTIFLPEQLEFVKNLMNELDEEFNIKSSD